VRNNRLSCSPAVMSVQDSLYESVRQLYTARMLPSLAAIRSRFEDVHGSSIDEAEIRRIGQTVAGLVYCPSDDVVIGAVFKLGHEPSDFRGFLDPMNVDYDPYPPAMWEHFERYLQTILQRGNRRFFTFNKGRHGCATELLRRALPFFNGLVLGELCHVVQIALSVRNLLGYTKAKEIVPWSLSDTGKKARNAQVGKPTVSTKDKSQPAFIMDWDTLTQVLLVIFSAQDATAMPLSMLKDKVRSAGYELSETAFGRTKLADLLKDRRLHEICQVTSAGGQLTIAPSPLLAAHQQARQCHPVSAVAVGGMPMPYAGHAAVAEQARQILLAQEAMRMQQHLAAAHYHQQFLSGGDMMHTAAFPVEVSQMPTQQDLDAREEEVEYELNPASDDNDFPDREMVLCQYNTFLEVREQKPPQRKYKTAPDDDEMRPVYSELLG